MSAIIDPKNELTFAVLQASASKAANFNSAVVADIRDYIGNVTVIANIGTKTVGDSDGTLDIRLMTSAESNGANATNLNINFSQVNSTQTTLFETVNVDTRSANRYLKAVAVIAGTNTPTYPVSLSIVGQKQVE